MIDPNNPFDSTIWDPGGEHAIEDPFHGPSAVQDMLQTPAMPLGDGRYYQPGGSYVLGTNYVDSKDRPLPPVIRIASIGETLHEGYDLREWLEAYHTGEEALVELEAQRQQRRLDATGSAHAFKPSDVCAGGKKIESCETATKAMAAAQEWGEANSAIKAGEGLRWDVLAWLGGKCGECALSCEVAVKTVDGQADEIRFTNYRPRTDIPVIHIEASEPAVLNVLFKPGTDSTEQ